MAVDIRKLDSLIAEIQAPLRGSLLAAEVWERNPLRSLAAINPQPAAVALEERIYEGVQQALSQAGWPGLHQYYLMELAGGELNITLICGTDLMMGLLVDGKANNLGVAFSVIIPKCLQGIEAARL